MLIASLFVLSAVRVNGLPEDQPGSARRTKQLDLLDIQAPVKEDLSAALPSLERKNATVINGYLPPAPPSSAQPSIVGAQTVQSFNFQPLNSLEKENELCKFPSCDSISGPSSDSEIPKPSKNLMPPFDDLEREAALPTGTTPREEVETKITTRAQSKFPTTTERLVTARTASKNSKLVASATTVQAFSSKAEATNELRSYLPPRPVYSAAAQTNVAVVRPPRPNTDHDHHHHGKDFDICADAFHSFLCAPLKARKRITGAFPSSLRGQSSFINYQKLLPNYEREPAPSNTLQNAYLPPKHTPSPANLIQPTRSSPLTLRPRPTLPFPLPAKVIPAQSDSKDRFYLPPLTLNRLVPAPSAAGQAFTFPRPKSTPSPAPTATTPRPTTASTAFTNPSFARVPVLPDRASSQPPLFNVSPSNENRFHLPPSINPRPAPSIVSTSANIPPITPTISSRPSVPASLPAAVPTSQFISTTRKPQPVLSAFTTATKPSTAAGKLQPSTSSAVVTTPSALPSRASPSFNSVSPVSQTRESLPTAASKFAGQSSSEDRSYLPPDTNLAAAAQTSSAAFAPKNPFHHGRDLCTDPFHSFLCVSAKPRKRITGELPSGGRDDSTNPQESRLNPEVAHQSENKVEAASSQLGYKYPKPNRIPAPADVIPTSTATPSPGYSYSKPDKDFPQQSQRNVGSTAATSSTTAKPEPRPSEARAVSGYQYPKPGISFPLPGEEPKPFPTTTSSSATGYSYPKPQKPLTLPTEQKEVVEKPKERPPPPKADTASPTAQVKGYRYPKPEQTLKLPEKGTGYLYPKPTKRLELPTENRLTLQTNANPSLDPVGALESADFIPVNKIDFKRSESKLMAGLRRFGERQKKRQRVSYLSRKAAE